MKFCHERSSDYLEFGRTRERFVNKKLVRHLNDENAPSLRRRKKLASLNVLSCNEVVICDMFNHFLSLVVAKPFTELNLVRFYESNKVFRTFKFKHVIPLRLNKACDDENYILAGIQRFFNNKESRTNQRVDLRTFTRYFSSKCF